MSSSARTARLSQPPAALRPGFSSTTVPRPWPSRANKLSSAVRTSSDRGCAWVCRVDSWQPWPTTASGTHKPQAKVPLNPLPPLRQPLGACLKETCPGLSPLSMPKWTKPAHSQDSVPIGRQFIFQVSTVPALSWPGCGRVVLVS
jgi:hypothetical protein